MGTVCCPPAVQQPKIEPKTHQLVNKNNLFSSVTVSVSSQPISKQSADMLIVFTDVSINLKRTQLLSKLHKNQLNTIRQYAKNIANQTVNTQDEGENDVEQGSQKSSKKRKTQGSSVINDDWKLIIMDNPIVRLDISTIMMVQVPVWEGQYGVLGMLRDLFSMVRPRIVNIENLSIIEVSSQIGIPLDSFHKVVIEMMYDLTRNNLQEILPSSEPTEQKVQDDQINGEQQSRLAKKEPNKSVSSQLKRINYLTNQQHSMNMFSKGFKQFSQAMEDSIIDIRSDYY